MNDLSYTKTKTMKATIEFDLNDMDEIRRYDLMNRYLDMGLVIWELVHNKRRELEASPDPVTELYDWLNNELERRGVNINELIQ